MPSHFSLFITLFISLSLISISKSDKCKSIKLHTQYDQVQFKKICRGFPATFPRFDIPVDCYTRKLIPELAFSIANQVFQCEKWCVYSIIDEANAWIWVPNSQCWKFGRGCKDFADELLVKTETLESLCLDQITPEIKSLISNDNNNSQKKNENKDCIPLVPISKFGLPLIRKKCPHQQPVSKPFFHEAINCQISGEDGELKQALANGAFSDCRNWCVYSLKFPQKIAWIWNQERNCWSTVNGCTNVEKERVYAENLVENLCEAPCEPPRQTSQLSVDLLKLKCPAYTGVTGPQFHHAKICGVSGEDEELKFSLVNFSFSSCSNWCVFSLYRPRDKAWLWDSTNQCWNENEKCLENLEEIDFAVRVQEVYCVEPTNELLESRLIQRATPEPEETGLWGDKQTQIDAIEMWRLFLIISGVAFVLVFFLQLFVSPYSPEENEEKKNV